MSAGADALLEAPAGGLDEDDPEACARREAEEEVGLVLRDLEPVAAAWTMPGVSTERLHLFLAPFRAADRIGEGGGLAEEHENIVVVETALARSRRDGRSRRDRGSEDAGAGAVAASAPSGAVLKALTSRAMPHSTETVALAADGASATIALCGAEPLSWRVAGRELIWHGDPAHWPQRAPILFPVVGASAGGAVRVEGRSYPMPRHGFARDLLFGLVERRPDRARFRLSESRATLRAFPFRFRLDVVVALAADRLSLRFP